MARWCMVCLLFLSLFVCCCLICLCDVRMIYDMLLYGLLLVLCCNRACGLSCNGSVLMRALLCDVVWLFFSLCVCVSCVFVFCV